MISQSSRKFPSIAISELSPGVGALFLNSGKQGLPAVLSSSAGGFSLPSQFRLW